MRFHQVDEARGANLAQMIVKLQRDHVIDPQPAEQHGPLRVGRQVVAFGDAFDDDIGVRKEGEHDGQTSLCMSLFDQRADQVLMTAVYAVKHPNRDHRRTIELNFFNPLKMLHVHPGTIQLRLANKDLERVQKVTAPFKHGREAAVIPIGHDHPA